MELGTGSGRLLAALGGAAAIAGPVEASSPSFVALVVDAGNLAGGLGSSISSSGMEIYQHAMGDNFPPSAAMIAMSPELEWDSYVALGGEPAAFGIEGRAPWMTFGGGEYAGFFGPANTPINNSDWTQTLGHLWFAPGLLAPPGTTAFSSPGPSGLESVFIARLTMPRGTRPIGANVWVSVETLHSRTLAAYHMTIDGPSQFFPIFTHSLPAPEASFQITSYLSAQVTLSDFGDADVYDLYIEAVPAPQQAMPPAPPAPIPDPVPPPPSGDTPDESDSVQWQPAPVVASPVNEPVAPPPQASGQPSSPAAAPAAKGGKKIKAPKPAKAPKKSKGSKKSKAPSMPQGHWGW